MKRTEGKLINMKRPEDSRVFTVTKEEGKNLYLPQDIPAQSSMAMGTHEYYAMPMQRHKNQASTGFSAVNLRHRVDQRGNDKARPQDTQREEAGQERGGIGWTEWISL